jgi:CSLREA domain-containing protein
MATLAVRAAAGLVVACGLLALGPDPAAALVFDVDSTTDDVDAAPGNGICATDRGACTLRAAVMEANATVAADTLNLPAGRFKLKSTGDGDASVGDLDVTHDLTVLGEGRDKTAIDGRRRGRIFDLVAGVRLVVEELTIRAGKANAFNDTDGGGIRSAGQLILNYVTLFGNRASAGVGSTPLAVPST